MPLTNLIGLTRDQLRAELIASGVEDTQARMRAGQVWHWIYQRGAASFEAMTNVSKALRAKLAARFTLARPEIVEAQVSEDGTRKWLLRFGPGIEIETVFIEGHTDSVPFASGGRDNFDLSLARARAVEQVMVLNGPLVDFKNKASQQVFSFSAYADKRPLPNTDPTDGVNRRVDLRIVLSYKPIEELIPALKKTAGDERP